MSDKCPGCGRDGVRQGNAIHYGCEAWFHLGIKEFVPSELCLENQVAQRDARIARLERACRAACQLLGQSNKIDWDDEVASTLRAALAQEATP